MENKIAVDITLSESSVENLSQIVSNSLSDKLIDTLKDDIEDNLDIESKINEWADEHLEDKVETIINDSDWFLSVIRDEVVDKIEDMDLNDYIDIDNDYDSIAQRLLEQYSPLTNCRTAEVFTDAIRDAFRFMLLKDLDLVSDIQKALDRQKRKEITDEIRGTIIKDTMEEMRDALRKEFIVELNEYSTAVENAKMLLGNENRQIHPLDLV